MDKLDEATCQEALDSKPWKGIEGNGFRVYKDGRKLVVQDLLEGTWWEFPTYTLPARGRRAKQCDAVGGKRRAIEACDDLARALRGWLDSLDESATITTGAVAAALLSGDNEHPEDASPLIPRVSSIASIVYPWDPSRAYKDIVRKVLIVTTALALMGGRAEEPDLRTDLRGRGFGDQEAREMIEVACKKGGLRRIRSFPYDAIGFEPKGR